MLTPEIWGLYPDLQRLLSFIRFLGLGLADNVPEANTIWTVREGLKKTGAVDDLFRRFDETLRREGFLAMRRKIADAKVVAAPEQRNTVADNEALRDGRIPDEWTDKPAKIAQKDQEHAGRSNKRRRSPARMVACTRRSRHSRFRLQEPHVDRPS